MKIDPTREQIDEMDAIERAFWQFHWSNPDVYDELRKLARTLMNHGRKHYGISALFEVVRYHRALKTTDPVFKLNNNHRALYARLLMEREYELQNFFETRDRPAKRYSSVWNPTPPE